jgi:hypothetical protein
MDQFRAVDPKAILTSDIRRIVCTGQVKMKEQSKRRT